MISSLEPAALPQPDTILSVRSGKIKPLGNDGLKSAIIKLPHQGRVAIGMNGIGSDEREYLPHQGLDNALHQYCTAHYPTWRRDHPDKAELFHLGAFGENLAASHLNEDNVCIGDIFRLGDGVVVQVTEPRTPCFKLNAHFRWPQASRRAQRSGRIGWYMRVLHVGTVAEGDLMTLVERPNPRWSIANANRVINAAKVAIPLITELQNLPGLGQAVHKIATQRLASELRKAAASDWLPYELVDARPVTARVRQLTFEFRGADPSKLAFTDLGSHAYVNIRFGPTKKPFERSYSVVSGDRQRFVLGVAFDDHSRGGSRFLHEDLRVGDRVAVVPGSNGAVSRREEGKSETNPVKRHVFVIGGIGVTAFLSEISSLVARAQPMEVHYAVRSMADAAYSSRLPAEHTRFYVRGMRRLCVDEVIPPPPSEKGSFDSKIYVCGPSSLMDACEARTTALGYPVSNLHFESFGADATAGGMLGEEFEVEVTQEDSHREKTCLKVPENQTLWQVLVDAGFEVPSLCRAGKCGICAVKRVAGEVLHKGTALQEDAKEESMLSCVSRGKGRIEIEIEAM